MSKGKGKGKSRGKDSGLRKAPGNTIRTAGTFVRLDEQVDSFLTIDTPTTHEVDDRGDPGEGRGLAVGGALTRQPGHADARTMPKVYNRFEKERAGVAGSE